MILLLLFLSSFVLTKAEENSTLLEIEQVTEKYDELITEFRSYCMNADDYRELYGNKSKPEFVWFFSRYLVKKAAVQINFDEFRRIHRLKLKSLEFENCAKEEYDIRSNSAHLNASNWPTLEVLNKVAKLACTYETANLPTFDNFFTNKEINVAVEFLDRRFPIVRQMQNLAIQKALLKNKWQNDKKEWASKMFQSIYFEIPVIISDVFSEIGQKTILSRMKVKSIKGCAWEKEI